MLIIVGIRIDGIILLFVVYICSIFITKRKKSYNTNVHGTFKKSSSVKKMIIKQNIIVLIRVSKLL